MKTLLLFQIDFLLGFSVCDKLLTHRLYIRPESSRPVGDHQVLVAKEKLMLLNQLWIVPGSRCEVDY